MATHTFDFQNYVDRQKNPGGGHAERGGFGDYAFAGDIRVLRRLERLAPVRLVVEATVRFWKTFERSNLLGNAARVTSRQYPQLNDLVIECAQILDIPTPTVYVKQGGGLGGDTYGTKDESFIVISALSLDMLSDEELRFEIGRQCGRIQNQHVVYHTAANYLGKGLGIYVKWATIPAGVALNGWSRRGSVTSDRSGMICAGSLETAISTILHQRVGAKGLDNFDLEEFLAQLDDLEQGWGRVREFTDVTPYLQKRIIALQKFAESNYFKNKLGEKGGRQLDEIDREIEDLISVL